MTEGSAVPKRPPRSSRAPNSRGFSSTGRAGSATALLGVAQRNPLANGQFSVADIAFGKNQDQLQMVPYQTPGG